MRLSSRLIAAAAPLLFPLSVLAAQAPRATPVLDALDRALAGLPPGFLDLDDVNVYTSSSGAVTVTATTTLLNARTNVLLALDRGSAGTSAGFVLGLRPDHWSLSESVPQLANPVLDGLTLSNVALVVTEDSMTRSAASMTPEERAFYSEVFHSDDFQLTLKPGINLLAGIPVDDLPEGHPLLAVMDALGIERGVVFLQGTIGKSLSMLASPGAGGLAVIKDLYLRAELPPMRPPNSPEWFRSGQLALELTGLPSVKLVGEMTVRVQEDDLRFFLAAALARTGVSLSGGLVADSGWVAPFGISWMTVNEVILKLGITPTGAVQLGFAGDLVIGTKDIDVAIAVAISPYPPFVPQNLIFSGASEAGFGLADLIMLQEQMSKARAAAQDVSGGPGPLSQVRIPIENLPDVEFRDVALKFAPKPEPDLGVERGMAIKGRLFLPLGSGGTLTDFAGVDVSVGEGGLWVRGDLGAFTLGPLVWDDALIDLTATAEDQHLRITGDATLFNARQKVDVELNRTKLSFHTRTELFDLFHVTLDADAAFDLRQPRFVVDGVAESDLSDVLGPIIQTGAVQFASAGQSVLRQSVSALTALQTALGNAQATADQLRAALENQRAIASTNVANARAAAATAATRAASALAARNSAYSAWVNTPLRQVSLRASRRNAYLSAVATHARYAAAYAASEATATALQRVLDALPPVSQNIALMAADRAVAELRAQLQTAAESLESIGSRLNAVTTSLEQGGSILTIQRAAVHADLEALMRGDAVRWQLSGTFSGRPFSLDQTIAFADMNAAGAQILTGLVGW